MRYKVLMIGNEFVNEMMLNRGLYACTRPALHDNSFTKEELLKQWQNYAHMANETIGEVEANISKCQIKTVEITIIEI